MTTHALHRQHRRRTLTWTLASCFCALMLASPAAQSQSVCSSDGQTAPVMLFERFINADCTACWSDSATPVAGTGALALDWIAPGDLGDDAALAAAASRDTLMRLEVLRRDRPQKQGSKVISVTGWPGAALRVAHGPALGGYVGASIALSLPPGATLQAPLEAWLVLVETLPIGVESSPVARNLVRNVLVSRWNKGDLLPNSEQFTFKETRPLNIPQGAMPERLRVVGWVQDASNRVLIAAESACPPEPADPR